MPAFPNPQYLTHPNIPKPLHGINPRTIMGQDWWDEKRYEAYATHDYRCWACGIHKTEAKYHHWLEAHEEYDIDYATGEVKLKGIIALCHSCHNFIHSGRLLMMWKRGEWPKEKCIDILRRGFDILNGAGLEPFHGTKRVWALLHNEDFVPGERERIQLAPWEQWHLVIDGTKHYSKFKNIYEWAEHYRR